MIDRYLLRYFLAVVDRGNFSRAAAQVGVSQPTLSVGIAKLERLLGQQLLRRTNRRVEITEAGARFAIHARRIEAEFNLAEQAGRGPQAQRTLRLGVLTTIPDDWITRLVALMGAEASEERVEFYEGREQEVADALHRNRIDAAFTTVDPTREDGEPLLTEGYSLALPQTHPLAAEGVVTAEALSADAMIARRNCEALSETSRHFTSRGVRPFIALRTTSDNRAIACVQAGLGVTVMPDGYRAPGVARPKLVDFTLTRTLGLVRNPLRAADLEEALGVLAVRALCRELSADQTV